MIKITIPEEKDIPAGYKYFLYQFEINDHLHRGGFIAENPSDIVYQRPIRQYDPEELQGVPIMVAETSRELFIEMIGELQSQKSESAEVDYGGDYFENTISKDLEKYL